MYIFKKERPPAVVIETIDGRAYIGQTTRDAIEKMRIAAWGCPSKTFRGYMLQVSRRTQMWNKHFVRTDTIENWINDLELAGIVTVRRMN